MCRRDRLWGMDLGARRVLQVSVSLKYAVVERERRYRVAGIPGGQVSAVEIHDRYLVGCRLRLRETRTSDGTVTRKLCQKIRLTQGPAAVACTNLYLDDDEWTALLSLPARTLTKTRHIIDRDGLRIAIDDYGDGILIAEIDDVEQPSQFVPKWLDVLEDVSDVESWTGVALAR